jgi:hypothetical protein
MGPKAVQSGGGLVGQPIAAFRWAELCVRQNRSRISGRTSVVHRQRAVYSHSLRVVASVKRHDDTSCITFVIHESCGNR